MKIAFKNNYFGNLYKSIKQIFPNDSGDDLKKVFGWSNDIYRIMINNSND